MFFLTSGDPKPPKSLFSYEFLISILGKTLPVGKKKTHWSLLHPNIVLIVFFPAPLNTLQILEIWTL
jgi:hypothetical protein